MNSYVYHAALWCAGCANKLMEQIGEENEHPDPERWPQGPYSNGGGEADTPQHCDGCGVFLENPLTPDGIRYVIEQLVNHARCGEGNAEVPKTWGEFYNFQVYEPGEVTIEDLRSEYALVFDGPDDAREWWFKAAGELYARGETLPDEWEYRPGLHPVDPDDFDTPLIAGATTRTLRAFADQLTAELQKHKEEGAFEEE